MLFSEKELQEQKNERKDIRKKTMNISVSVYCSINSETVIWIIMT